MRIALLAALILPALAQADQYWDVEETTLVRVRPSQYEDDVYYAVEPAAGPRFKWGNGGTWQGAYVGLNVGKASGKTTYTNPSNTGDSFKDNDSVSLGAQAGYNWQRGPLVMGVEADVADSNSKGDDHFSLGQQDIVKGKWEASARGRVGVDVGGVLMPYATAGWAWQSVDYTIYDDQLPATSTKTNMLNGPTYGGGLEMAISNNMSLRGEYRRTNLEGSKFDAPATQTDRTFERETDSLTFGLNYRFPNPPRR
ncbi:MAG: outer membrane beta-barrel protein [Alphaproteobacteria bacterium]